jgi:hypothetical protein
MCGTGYGNDRQVIAAGLFVTATADRPQLSCSLARLITSARRAAPLANLANSVAHRVALLG